MRKLLLCALTLITLMIVHSLQIQVVASSSSNLPTALEQSPDYYSDEHQSKIKGVNRLVDEYLRSKALEFGLRSAGGKLLAVPLYKQETTYWCGPASGQMALKFITGTLYSQTNLAGWMETTSAVGTYVWKLRRTLNDTIGHSAYQEVGTWQATFGNDLIYSIDNNKPIMCHVRTGALPNYSPSQNFGHYIAAIGYQWGFSGGSGYSNVTYNDPHFSDSHFGTFTCSVSTMETAINNNAGYYIRATR